MSNFENIKQQWASREIPSSSETGFNSVIEKSKKVHKKQVIGQWVLGITAAILIWFFFYISAYKNSQVFIGLGIMIGSLCLRIGIEFLSIVKKDHLPSDLALTSFRDEQISFYKRRKIIHFIVTPILFLSYIGGFMMLLPGFKHEFSNGFYLYILISSTIVFIALAILITYQIIRELKLLRMLMEEKI